MRAQAALEPFIHPFGVVFNDWHMLSASCNQQEMRTLPRCRAPLTMLRTVISRGVKTIMRRLSRSIDRHFGGVLRVPVVANMRLGDFGRYRPISSDFGFDRGKPIDRYYIERALGEYAELVRGRVLEVCGREYTSSFGAEKVVCSDVLDIDPINPLATIVGDLSVVDALPQDAFDCIVLDSDITFNL